MKKSQQLAATLNRSSADDYRQAAERAAQTLRVGLYWFGTASDYSGPPMADVWKPSHDGRRWIRMLGTIQRGHDGVWRAVE